MKRKVKEQFDREGPEFGRGLGFFDAIYGFAITLLVANIVLPPPQDWDNLTTLLDNGLGIQLFGFVISFVVIAAFWRGNTALLARFKSIDNTIIVVNLFGAGLIVLLPFTTDAISEPDLASYPLPAALYAANVALAVGSQLLLLEVGRAKGLLTLPAPARLVRAERADYCATILVFLLSIPVTYLFGPGAGELFWLLLVVTGPIFGGYRLRISEGEAAEVVVVTNPKSSTPTA